MTPELLAYLEQAHRILQLLIANNASTQPSIEQMWLEKLEQLSVAAIKAGLQK